VYFFIILVIDEWNNFMERINSKRESEVWGNEENVLQLRHWASLRGQTLCRTGSLVILPYLVSITWLFGT
jgi:callose synthase